MSISTCSAGSTWCAACSACLTGFSLGVLASGTRAALDELTSVPAIAAPADPTVWLFILAALIFVGGGVLLMSVGRAVVRRARYSRPAALALAVPTLLVVPFGTALGVYTFWVLLNDDARGEFHAPPIQSEDGTRS